MLEDLRPLLWSVALLVAALAPARAADPAPDAALDFFENEIRPLLVKRCHECHGEAEKVKGGLNLTSRETAIAGGETGPAIVPGKPAESLLVEAIRYQSFKMPPKAKLPEAEIDKLVRWVEMGVPWPDAHSAARSADSVDQEFKITDAQRGFWSFQSIRPQAIPNVRDANWAQTPLDRFVLARLESQGIRPNPTADKRTLLRRVTFDLIGLPPTPQEIDAFLGDDAPDALPRVVDRLLASPHYGERWGRHWLDVARYADTAGETADFPVPQAYKYRNWVIAAFNRDLPYDEFIRQQIAGDILARGAPREAFADCVTATGYIAISRRFGFDSENYHHLTIADTLDTLGRSILGLSIGCARCHDHKYDPISMADYYALYGIFASSRYAFPGSEEKKQPREFAPLLSESEAAPLAAAFQQQVTRCDAELKRLDGELAELNKQIKTAEETAASQSSADAANPPDATSLAERKTQRDRLASAQQEWRGKREHLLNAGPYEVAYGVMEAAGQNAKIQKRGEPTKLGAEVPRRFLEILGGDVLPPGDAGSGRLELADWLTRRGNPLTARVIVNRVWQYHFGRGLVASPSDFGFRGRPPTHPELLDYLADSLMNDRWSLKALHRTILLSRTYQMTTSDDNPAARIDPGNDTWWKFERRRLDAEALRDAVLAASGGLDRAPGGAHPFPPSTTWGFTQHAPFKAVYDTNARSVYLMTQRIQKHPILALFDGADPNTSTAERSVTTTPSQALFLMNSPFIHEQSQTLARRLLAERIDDTERVRLAHALVFAQDAAAAQTAEAIDFLDRYRQQSLAVGVSAEQANLAAWAAYSRVLLTSNAFLYID